jgi:hypothetical protein
LDRALRLADGDALASHLLVKIRGALVDSAAGPAAAASVAADGERLLAEGDVCEQCSMSFRVAAANAFIDVADLPEARRHLDDAARVSEMWQGGPWPAAVRRTRQRLEVATAQPPG